MKVRIKDLVPNPFRDMKNYPIDKAKVQQLVDSIKQTGFWDNVLARIKNGKAQIAYGHHRLVALQQVFKPDDEVGIPVRKLDDATMLRIMANENMEEWRTLPAVIDETVRVAKQFLDGHPEEVKKIGQPKKSRSIGRDLIARFLGWPPARVQFALERLGMVDAGKLDKKAVEGMRSDSAARKFTAAVKKYKVPPAAQRKAAAKIVEEEDYSENGIEDAVVEQVLPEKKKDAGLKRFEDFILEVQRDAAALERKLRTLIEYKKEFDSALYNKCVQRGMLADTLDTLIFWTKKLFAKEGKGEKKKEAKSLPERSQSV